jgi:hypothetical protein
MEASKEKIRELWDSDLTALVVPPDPRRYLYLSFDVSDEDAATVEVEHKDYDLEYYEKKLNEFPEIKI